MHSQPALQIKMAAEIVEKGSWEILTGPESYRKYAISPLTLLVSCCLECRHDCWSYRNYFVMMRHCENGKYDLNTSKKGTWCLCLSDCGTATPAFNCLLLDLFYIREK